VPWLGQRDRILTDGHTGLLVNRDPHEFAAAVERLLTDSAFAERLGQQGRADVDKRWTWERAVCQIERYLEKAIRGNSAADSDQKVLSKKVNG